MLIVIIARRTTTAKVNDFNVKMAKIKGLNLKAVTLFDYTPENIIALLFTFMLLHTSAYGYT